MSNELGVLAIGNALVDVLVQADESFIQEQVNAYGMARNAMTLVNEERAETLYREMQALPEKECTQMSGGSAANTMACYASLGGTGGFVGKVSNDKLGKIFADDMRQKGVQFETTPLHRGNSTGRCLILVDSDGRRSMSTYLGAAVELGPEDIDEQQIGSASVVYLEGYLFDPENAKKAFEQASNFAHKNGNKIALTLSDPFCVDRHREDFKGFIEQHVDILFANEEEITSLYQRSYEDIVSMYKGLNIIAAMTRSEHGSTILHRDEVVDVPAAPTTVVDTTGAGDAYSAGFLFGYVNNEPLEVCGRYAAISAAEVVSHMGPRPEANLAELIAKQAA